MGAIASGARKKLSPLRHHQFDDQQRVWGAPKLVMVMSSHREVDWTSGLKLQASPSLFLLWYWDVIGWYWNSTSAVELVESPLLLPAYRSHIAYAYTILCFASAPAIDCCNPQYLPCEAGKLRHLYHFIIFYIHLYALISKAILTGPPIFGYPDCLKRDNLRMEPLIQQRLENLPRCYT